MSISANPKDIRALVLDLDGTTLAPAKVLTERTIRAVKACERRGLRIIVATGRALEAAEPFRSSLGVKGPMIYCNGAMVADMPGENIISATLLDVEAALFCADLSRETGVYYQVFFPGWEGNPRRSLMTEQDMPEREMYHQHTGLLPEIGDLKEALSRPGLPGCIKCMFLAEPAVQDTLRPKIDARLGDSVYVAQTYLTFLEIMNSKVSKGAALKFILEKLSLRREEVIAFGDEENDLPMLTAAGYAIAPSNAKENVRAAADLVIGSNAEDGVAAFLEDFFGLG